MSELVEKLFAVHEALQDAALPHAFGGAIALAYCVDEPRGTRDLDVNVFVDPTEAETVLDALPGGVRVKTGELEKLQRDGQVRLFWGGVPVDIFLNNLPLHEEVSNAVVWAPLEGRQIPLIDCASLVIFKALFGRTKDWADIEAIAAAAPQDLDAAVRTLRGLIDDDDEAVRRLASIRATGAVSDY